MQEWEDVFKFVIMALAVAVFVAIGIELVIGWRLPARQRAGARSPAFEWARLRGLRHRGRLLVPAQHQIIVRSGDRVHYVSLSRRAQFAIAGLAFFALVWAGFGTLVWIDFRAGVAGKAGEVDGVGRAAAEAHADGLQQDVARLSATIAQNEAELDRLTTLNQSLLGDVAALEERQQSAAQSQVRDEQSQAALRQRLAQAKANLVALGRTKQALDKDLAATRARLQGITEDRARIVTERDKLRSNAGELELEVAELGKDRGGLATELGAARRELAAIGPDRHRLAEERDALRADLRVVEGQLPALTGERDALAMQLNAARQEVAALSTDRSRLAGERDDFAEELDAARQRLVVLDLARGALVTELSETEGHLADLTGERDGLARRLDAAEQKVAAIGAERDGLATERDRLLADLNELDGRLADLAGERERLAGELDAAQGQVAAVGAERDRVLAERDGLAGDLNEAKGRIADDRERLAKELDAARQAHAALGTERDRVIAERDNLQAERDGKTADLNAVDGRLADLTDERDRLNGELDAARQEFAAISADRDRVTEERDALAAEQTIMLGQLASLAAAKDRLAAALDAERLAQRVAQRQRIEGDSRIALADHFGPEGEVVKRRLASKQLSSKLGVADIRLADMIEARDRLIAERNQLVARLDVIEENFGRLTQDHGSVIARLDESTSESLGTIERTIAMTGLDVDRLLQRVGTGSNGQGGPFIAFTEEQPGTELANRLARLESQIDRMDGLQRVLATLPLASPLDNGWQTSPYGKRRDPISGRWALHSGLDMTSHAHSPIYATAPGRVTFVGWRGGFGKMVEIDHGLGVRTRYGHMRAIYVERGQKIDFRDRLGQLGNTGRSTGSHLHYEILIDGNPQDPAKFLSAGKHVFKG